MTIWSYGNDQMKSERVICLFNYWSYKYEDILKKKNHLDIRFRDIINESVISDVLTSYFISDEYFFFENIFFICCK